MINRDDFVDFQEQGISLPKTTHGGKRPGAGRPPRKDDRHLRLLRIRLTDQEHIAVLMLSTDERREVLLEAVKAKY